jgi:lipoprotein-anchoring transpeptidase ErfK/SrfK
MKLLSFSALAGCCGLVFFAGRTRADESSSGAAARLAAAIEIGDVQAIEVALAGGADATRAGAAGESLLHRAVWNGNAALVKLCLDYCADWKAPGQWGQNALTMAVVRGQTDVAATLLENGADPNIRLAASPTAEFRNLIKPSWLRQQMIYDRGFTPLMVAAAAGNEPMVRVLLDHGAKRTVFTSRYKMPPLSFSCREGQSRITQLLVGRDPNADDQPIRVVISLSRQRASLFRGQELLVNARCSTGRKGFATPTGTYVVTSKHPSWISNLYHVPMPNFMRLNGSAIGMHSGVVPGYPASHGCIRLPSHAASKFYRQVRVGDPVQIVH